MSDPELPDASPVCGGQTRRTFIGTTAAGLTATLLTGETTLSAQEVAPITEVIETIGEDVALALKVNGIERKLQIDPRVTVLDLLRERLGLTGSKKGCDHGQCGACTVLIDGRRVNSCLSLAVVHDGAEITTIEGLAKGEELHPLQAAFIKCDGFQCGYCTPGQIMSACALLKEGCPKTSEGVRELMSGNICRCGAYNGIVQAISEVRDSQAA